MEINRVSGAGPVAPVNLDPRSLLDPAVGREIVAAVRALNKSEFGDEHQLLFARDRETHRPVIRIVNRETGETIDQIPPETVLRMLAGIGLEKKEGGASL
jgi:FlaG protein